MENDSVVFKANTRRVLLRSLVSFPIFLVYIMFNIFLLKSMSAETGLLIFLSFSFVLFMISIFMFVLALGTKYSVVISRQGVEGIGSGFRRRIIVPLNEINVAESGPPALLRHGFLKTCNGEIIYLPLHYFNKRDTKMVLDEISRRQKEFVSNSDKKHKCY